MTDKKRNGNAKFSRDVMTKESFIHLKKIPGSNINRHVVWN